MSDDKILEEIGADLVGKRLIEESFWAKMAEERPSLFARVSQFVRDLLDRVTAAFRADPLPAAWVKDFDAIRRHIDAMMGQWAEKNARAKTGGTPSHSGNTREVLDGRDETVRNAGRNGGEGSDHAVDFSKATGEDMARLLTSWATEDEEEMEDALHNLPRKDGKVNGPDSL